eukprot:148717-Rhodomonas_salina.3
MAFNFFLHPPAARRFKLSLISHAPVQLAVLLPGYACTVTRQFFKLSSGGIAKSQAEIYLGVQKQRFEIVYYVTSTGNAVTAT